ncbi:MAG: PIN domain protein [Bacteroidetes bacterium RIFCSPLOWO2_02_FULL_36_8]|nr:MAG: PIN domain protein [Bacteroidetes bacterium RIFCSPLOWO2_02_FULL_36_8]OFY69395.1 MAG: PIN domain protein [Bacteroidetes bacterium RIFCSPLOWO2_12_FULL_37_12]
MKIYADTSAIGGCFDDEFQQWSNELFDEFKSGTETLMLSDLTIQELELGREEVRNKVKEIPKINIIHISITDEAIRLGETYIVEGALTNKSYNDALHIALATIFNADVLTSWNFRHIVNLNRIRLYNSINLRLGYRIIEIRTPREILKSKDNEK